MSSAVSTSHDIAPTTGARPTPCRPGTRGSTRIPSSRTTFRARSKSSWPPEDSRGPTSGTPDLLIHYHASINQRIDVNRLDREYGYCYDDDCRAGVIEYEAGTLVLDIVDTRTNRVIWRGWAQDSVEGVLDNHRDQIGRYGLSIDDVNMLVETAIGGTPLANTIEGRQRFSINVRLPQDYRNSIDRIKRIPIKTAAFGTIPLSSVAEVRFENGPPMISSDNAMLRGAVLFNVRDRDLGSTVKEAIDKVNSDLTGLPSGYFVEWSGQYENLIRGKRTLVIIAPVVLLIIFLSLYLAFKSIREAFLSLITVPFALIGGAYIIYFYGVHLSVAVAVGFIALFGIAVETGVVMVIYLNDAMQQLITLKGNSRDTITKDDLREYVIAGRR